MHRHQEMEVAWQDLGREYFILVEVTVMKDLMIYGHST
jgi:hypothetical protein